MTTMIVPKAERGHARIFAVDLPAAEAENLTREELATLLGIETLAEDQHEFFPVGNLEGIGLAGYLTEGMGMDPAEVRADAARLNALKGHVLILPSAAVRGLTLTPRAPLRWIGTYSEPVTVAPMDRLHSDAAERSVSPTPPTKRPSEAKVMGRVALVALAVIALLVVLMIVIA